MSFTQPKPARQRVQRCELAVPASSVKMIEKSADCAADFVFLDLEDAVAPGD
ncbi:MAG: CoA ester lyase, partial [Gammaproteobacteria bacterium]|nr:CoA ester lyase [Gammaproteobacteria bacterium]